MTDTTDLIQRLSDEADLCRNDGATDIAGLLDEAQSALEQQAAQIEALRADTERYRWLRNQKESLYYLIPGAREAMGFVDLADMPQFDELDAAIDTVMREEQPTKGEGA